MKTAKRIISHNKLLNSKWTAVTPTQKEKHFIVVKLIQPENLDQEIEFIVLEAVYSKRVQTMPWHALNDECLWLQGWQ